MFSTTGLFKDISCSYFLFGLCERPYCHFKHSRQEEAKARIEAEKTALLSKDANDDYKPPTTALQRTLQDIENSIQSEKRKFGGHDSALGQQNKKQQKTSVFLNKPTGTPEYNPTPIQELKKRADVQPGRSKYDLALLEGPETDSEYDPASNFSTGYKSSQVGENDTENSATDQDAIPDYAVTLHGTKRHAEENDEEDSPLAKIPKFVSVDYTPAVNDSAEFSDEEPLGEKQDWFSDDASDKGSESDKISDSELSKDELNKTKTTFNIAKSENKELDITNILPIEFTADGFVKATPLKAEETVKEIRKNSNKQVLSNSKENNVSEEKEKDRSDDNIFSLFKEEFDNALEKCSSSPPLDDKSSVSVPEVTLKAETTAKELKSEKSVSKLSKDSDKKHKSSSHHKNGHHKRSSSSSKSPQQVDNTPNVKSKSKHKHSSGSSSDRHHTLKANKHKTNGAISDKHKHSDKSEHKHSDKSEHKASDKSHNSALKHRSSSKHRDSKSSSKDKESQSSSNERRSSSGSRKSLDSKHRSSVDKQNTNSSSRSTSDHSKDKHKTSNSSKSSSKSSSSVSKHKESTSTSKQHSKSGSNKSISPNKKKQIVNLDVDLFGVGSDDGEEGEQINDNDYDDLSDLDKYFEDEDPFEECQRIFNEESAKVQSTSRDAERKKLKKKVDHENVPPAKVGKTRVALKQSDPEAIRKKISDKPTPKPSPAQVMMNRYKMMQERALEAERENKEKIKAKVKQMSQQNTENAANRAGPSQPNLASASATFTTYIANKNKKTSAITVAKGAKRKAHAPTVPIAQLKRPTVEVSSSSKVPSSIRHRYMNQFIDECLKIYSSEEEAFKRGKEEEEAVYKRCSNKKIYLNFAVNTIKRLRTEADQRKSGESTGSSPKKLSHAAVLDGAGATKTTFTVHRSGGAIKLQEEDFTGADLYNRLKPYVLTEEQLKENNFPHADPAQGGMAVFYGEEINAKTVVTKGYEKLCIRCGKIFEVYPNGKYPVKQECVYHWGKAWKKRIAGSLETRYTCCQGDLASQGCQVAKLHVHESNKKENKTGFMKTIPGSPAIDADYGVYALDCEMVYTTMGVELARVTVVGADEEPVYESLVLPDNPIIDLNTRFSGITEEDMEDIHTSLRDVQAVLLSLFTDKTILIGHSLESDLAALKLIHYTVVDTSVVFPHRLGRPLKRALRNLMAEFLKKIIQDDVGGHDSLEDAVACLQLMQFRLKEDARKEARRVSY